MPARKKRKPAKHKARAKVKRVVRRKRTRRKIAAKSQHRASVGRKRKARKKRTVRRGQRVKVIHVVAGKKKRRRSRSHSSTSTRRRSTRRKPVVMAGRRRSRSVGKKGNTGLLIGLGVGALLLYFMSRPKTVTYPNLNQLPPLNATNNYQRNDQQNSILQYALAASLGIDAITKLIQSLNSSSDSQVQQIYDHVETTGTIPDTVYV